MSVVEVRCLPTAHSLPAPTPGLRHVPLQMQLANFSPERSPVLPPFGERPNEAVRLGRRRTSVTPAEIASRTYYRYERGTRRWPGGLQATGRTMRGDCQRLFRAYCSPST